MAGTGKTVALINSLSGKIDPEEVQQDVNDWLEDHPEATTTVQDGAISRAKLDADLKAKTDEVVDLKSALKMFEDGSYQLLSGGMLKGSINADGSIDTSIGYRAYTPELQIFDRDITLNFTSPATGYFLVIYKSDGATVDSRTFYESSHAVSANTKFRVAASAASNTDSSILYKTVYFQSLLGKARNDISTNTSAINTEITTRASEDTAIQNAVNAELGTFEDGTYQLMKGGMQKGSINSDGTIDSSVGYRAYTPELQHFDRAITISFASPAIGFFLALYNSSGVFQSRTWYDSTQTISANTYFRICPGASGATDANVLYKSITFKSIIKEIREEILTFEDWEDFKQYALMNNVVLFSGDYIRASVNSSGVVDTSQTYRVTTKEILKAENVICLRINTGWQVWLTTYQQDGTFIERVNKTAGDHFIPAGTYFRVTIGKTTESPGNADIENFALNVFISNIDETSLRKWVAVGDSLTEVNQTATERYCDYVAGDLKLNLVNMGVGGTGYYNGHDNNKAFYQRIQNAPDDADVYTIFGSGNDGGSSLNNFPIGNPDDTGTDSLCGCINKTIDNLYTLNPSAVLGIITPTPWAIWPPYGTENPSAALPSGDPAWMRKYSEAIVAVCKRRGIPCLDLYHCSAMRPWDSTFRELFYSNDGNNGVHPDENGHRYFIAPHVNAFVRELLSFAG